MCHFREIPGPTPASVKPLRSLPNFSRPPSLSLTPAVRCTVGSTVSSSPSSTTNLLNPLGKIPALLCSLFSRNKLWGRQSKGCFFRKFKMQKKKEEKQGLAQSSLFFPSIRGQKSRSSPQLWRVFLACTVSSPPCSTCTAPPSLPSTRWVWGKRARFPRVSGYYEGVHAPGWAGEGSRAPTLRLGHLGWGTAVRGKESKRPSIGLGGAFLRPQAGPESSQEREWG